MGKILARGHSRVPVYSGNPRNVIGLLLVKSLLTVRPETETPVSAVSIRQIPRVHADMHLYDILNEFQKGSSHTAVVVQTIGKNKVPPSSVTEEKSEENDGVSGNSHLTTPLLSKPESVVLNIEKAPKPILFQFGDAATNGSTHVTENIEDGEVVGIITLEDVFEELLQDTCGCSYRPVASSSMARIPSLRRLAIHKGALR